MNNKKNLKPNDPIKTLKRLFSYFKFNIPLLVFGLLLTIVSSVANIAVNAMLSPIIDTMIGEGISQAFINLIIQLIVIVLVISISDYFGQLSMAKLSQSIVHRLREDMFNKVHNMPMGYFDTHQYGDILSTFVNDTSMITQTLESTITQFIISVVTVVGSFIVMLKISFPLTIIVVGFLALMFLSVKVVGTRSAKYFRRKQSNLADMNGYIEEMMSGQKVIQVFNREDQVIDDFSERNQELRVESTKASVFGRLLWPIFNYLAFAMYGAVAMAGSLLVLAGSLTIGNITAYLQFTRSISRPVSMLAQQFNSLFAALAGAERVFALLDEEVEEDNGRVRAVNGIDNPDKKFWVYEDENNVTQYIPIKGNIEFKNVNFSYVEGKPILKNINIKACPNQKIALVGSTGAGKTTITNLINRFYEIDSGEILYDGINIKDINKFDLRSTLSVVLQDVYLFKGSVADNIRYGRLDASDVDIVDASMMAHSHGFINRLPKGYETDLIEGGDNISMGEKQLVSIARAAIAKPNVLILDETTSSVDTRTEKLIQKGMDKLMENRTTFVIAHRLSTVRDSDIILVMEQGEIIERGNHDELMALKGRYYDLNTGKAELE